MLDQLIESNNVLYSCFARCVRFLKGRNVIGKPRREWLSAVVVKEHKHVPKTHLKHIKDFVEVLVDADERKHIRQSYKLAKEFAQNNLKLVYSAGYGIFDNLDDVFAEGYFALLRACLYYTDAQYQLSTFVYYAVRRDLKRYKRYNKNLVYSRSTQYYDLKIKVNMKKNELGNKFGRKATLEEVVESLNLNQKEVKTLMCDCSIGGIDFDIKEKPENIPEDKISITTVLKKSKLSPVEADAVKAHINNVSAETVADKYSITRRAVYMAYDRGIGKLRDFLKVA